MRGLMSVLAFASIALFGMVLELSRTEARLEEELGHERETVARLMQEREILEAAHAARRNIHEQAQKRSEALCLAISANSAFFDQPLPDGMCLQWEAGQTADSAGQPYGGH